MYKLREAILRNCYLGSTPDGQNFTISENAGYIVFTWPDGKTTRLQRSANGVDAIIPLPDGTNLRVSPGLF
jgi:hypothetical protein